MPVVACGGAVEAASLPAPACGVSDGLSVNMILGGVWVVFYILGHNDSISVCMRREISHYPISQDPLISVIFPR